MITGNFHLNGKPFAEWFNNTLKADPLFRAGGSFMPVWAPGFDAVMQRISLIFGTPGLNLYEFIAIFANIYNETGGTFISQRERGSMAYFFETRDMGGWTKQSYNRPVNGTRQAGDYLKLLGIISKQAEVAAWNGIMTLPTSPPEAVANAKRCDFYRFRGFGLNQITWRSLYEACVQPHLPKKMDEYGVDEFEALTNDLGLACKAMNTYIRQDSMKVAMRDITHGEFYNYGRNIGGGYYSTHVFVPRCTRLAELLKPYFLPDVKALTRDQVKALQQKVIASSPDAAFIIAKSGGADGIWGKASQQAYLVAGL